MKTAILVSLFASLEIMGGVTVRVLSYNVRSMRDDRAALGRVIRACEPDVVCVQEAPRFLRWRSLCAQLARTSGLVVVTGGRSAGSMLLLADLRVRVLYTEDVQLRKLPKLHQRGLAMAVMEIQGARFGVASMHLSLDEAERDYQVAEVLAHLRRLSASELVLAGDVNEQPDGPRWQGLVGELTDAYVAGPWGGEFTFPARGPARRIDGIFVSSGIEVMRCGVPTELPELDRASDHLPVLAELRIPTAANPR
ncbi:MAG: endonuclease/exonuclease/phosphatase family protein [Sporichthyaceae bacterium]|nr:endonuclease/exonuclease/phosphatase family protein [Sporichthyaceae bacterium]